MARSINPDQRNTTLQSMILEHKKHKPAREAATSPAVQNMSLDAATAKIAKDAIAAKASTGDQDTFSKNLAKVQTQLGTQGQDPSLLDTVRAALTPSTSANDADALSQAAQKISIAGDLLNQSTQMETDAQARGVEPSSDARALKKISEKFQDSALNDLMGDDASALAPTTITNNTVNNFGLGDSDTASSSSLFGASDPTTTYAAQDTGASDGQDPWMSSDPAQSGQGVLNPNFAAAPPPAATPAPVTTPPPAPQPTTPASDGGGDTITPGAGLNAGKPTPQPVDPTTVATSPAAPQPAAPQSAPWAAFPNLEQVTGAADPAKLQASKDATAGLAQQMDDTKLSLDKLKYGKTHLTSADDAAQVASLQSQFAQQADAFTHEQESYLQQAVLSGDNSTIAAAQKFGADRAQKINDFGWSLRDMEQNWALNSVQAGGVRGVDAMKTRTTANDIARSADSVAKMNYQKQYQNLPEIPALGYPPLYTAAQIQGGILTNG